MIEFAIRNGVVLLDDGDVHLVDGLRWRARKSFNTYYAESEHRHGKPAVMMHRVIIVASKGVLVDHRDGNGLHNFRNNLRICSNAQNQMNRRVATGSSGLKGVGRHRGKWQARITVDGRERYLGLFDDLIDASTAYDEAATNLFGSFAAVNRELFPELMRRNQV